MPLHFCTISTASHLFKTYALADSLRAYDGQLQVLLVDNHPPTQNEDIPQNVTWLSVEQLKSDNAKQIISKYADSLDKMRWSLKAELLIHSLSVNDKVIYVDNDIFFFDSPKFLFDELDANSILLSPHRYPSDPKNNQNWLEANYRVGLFNAGFLGANKGALKMLQWWSDCCLYRCEKSYYRGLFDDQKYLDLVPVKYPSAKILQHKGCNVAAWNKDVVPRKLVNGKLMLDDSFPLVFYHFNGFSIKEYLDTPDTVIQNTFDDYLAALKKHRSSANLAELAWKDSWIRTLKLKIWTLLNRFNQSKSFG